MAAVRTAVWTFPIIILVSIGAILYSSFRTGPGGNTAIRVGSADVLRELRELSRLETASFTIEKIIDAGTQGGTFTQFLFGDRLLLIAHGEVVAGFDLAALDDDAVRIADRTATIDLPPPVVLATRLDNDETRVYDRRSGILTDGDKDLESKARAAAEDAIRASACANGILGDAGANARKQLTALLRTLGFQTVIVNIPDASC